MKGLAFSIRSYMFRSSGKGTSFQTIVRITIEAELLERKEFGDLKRVQALDQFKGTSSGGRGFHKEGDTSQH